MNRHLLRLGVGVSMIVGTTSCYPSDSAMVSSCEASIKKTLLAPTTFRRANLTEGKEQLTFEQYYADNPDAGGSPALREFQRKMAKRSPVRLIAFIEYDAANAYGTPLRSIAKCTYDAFDGDDGSNASEVGVRVNGKTTSERLYDQAKRLTGNGK